jgi:glutaredoxin
MKWFPLLLMILLCSALPAGGDIYTWVDENGVKHFSTEPPAEEKNVERREEIKHSSDQYDQWEEQRKAKQDKILENDPSGGAASEKDSPAAQRMTKGKGPVVMYATPTCGYCAKARVFFSKHQIAYTEYDITKDKQARARYTKLNGRGVPLILVGDRQINGFSEQTLRRLLNIK